MNDRFYDIDEDAEWVPEKKVGEILEGWELSLNRRAKEGPKNGLFATIDDAKEAVCSFGAKNIVWIEAVRNPLGQPTLRGESLDHPDKQLNDIWHISPVYESIFAPLETFVLPFSGAKYFAAPDGSLNWAVFDRFMNQVESFLDRDEAIESAARLSLGFKTKKQVENVRFIATRQCFWFF